MLAREDLLEVRQRFGADDAQVRRDHLISHLLAALAELARDEVVFFGGTALARTYLPGGRLSEDIDLYTANRPGVAESLTDRWPRAIRREFPGTTWDPALVAVRDIEAASIVAEDGSRVRVQLLAADATYAKWPSELRSVEARYRDVVPFELVVPTRDAFVAMKAAAWSDRRKARDLFDLAELARLGAVNVTAIELLRTVTGVPLPSVALDSLPACLEWEESLQHQTRLSLGAEQALGLVREEWTRSAPASE